MLHHYAGALNSIALFDRALASPRDGWLWRLAGSAASGPLSTIRPSDGSASMGWHSDPGLLRLDDFTSDWGLGLYGHWRHAGAHLVCDDGEWLCLSCDIVGRSAAASPAPNAAATASPDGSGQAVSAALTCGEAPTSVLQVVPRDAFRRRAYLQPLGLILILDGAAAIDHVALRLPPTPNATFHLRPLAGVAASALLVSLERDGAPEPLVADGQEMPERRCPMTVRCTDSAGPGGACRMRPPPFPRAAERAAGMLELELEAGWQEVRVEVSEAREARCRALEH